MAGRVFSPAAVELRTRKLSRTNSKPIINDAGEGGMNVAANRGKRKNVLDVTTVPPSSVNRNNKPRHPRTRVVTSRSIERGRGLSSVRGKSKWNATARNSWTADTDTPLSIRRLARNAFVFCRSFFHVSNDDGTYNQMAHIIDR